MSCICSKDICTGCQACYQYCKNNNIRLIQGTDGFKYPEIINKKLCADCDFICPQLKYDNETSVCDPLVFAVQLKSEENLIASTSGGMFYAVSDYIFKHGGVVFGAEYDNNMNVVHKVAINRFDLDKMHGSKYVQSDITGVYKKVLIYLEKGIPVLFSGLPCQVAGLKAFLQNDYTNLVTMDVICSGVPSPLLFAKYIEYLQNKKKIKILDYKFRDKHKYGCSHTVVITYIDRKGSKKEKTIPDRNRVSYYVAFGKENCFMTACYNCKYNTLKRISDFTVGGFWGIKYTDIKMEEKKGVSLVLANTKKALRIMSYVKQIAIVRKSDVNSAVIDNRALLNHTPFSSERNNLYSDLNRIGYKKTAKKYFKPVSPFVKKIKTLHRIISDKLYKKPE